MAGLLSQLGLDMDEVEAPSYDIPDDIYEFEVGDFFIKKGIPSNDDYQAIVIDYKLGSNGRSKSEWFRLPENMAAPTEKELQILSIYKGRLASLGVAPEDMNDVGPDDLIGLTGTLQVFTKKVGDNSYQNIKNVRLSKTDSEEAGEVSKPARTQAPAAPKPNATVTKARGNGVKANPFA